MDSETKLLENTVWVLVKQEATEKQNFIKVIGPIILHFTQDTMTMIPNDEKNSVSVEYSLIGDQLNADSLFNGTVTGVGGDNMTLIPNDSTEVIHFVSVDKLNSPVEQAKDKIINILTSTPTQMRLDNDTTQFYFNIIPEAAEYVPFTPNIVHYRKSNCTAGDCFKGEKVENWSFKTIEGRAVLIYSYYSYDYEILEIKEITPFNELSLKYINSQVGNINSTGSLVPISLDTNTYFGLNQRIIGEWSLSKIVSSKPELDSIRAYRNYRELNDFYKRRLVRQKDLNTGNVNLIFSEGKYDFSVGGYQLVDREGYEITKDGKYIVVGNGITKNDYIEIISVSEDKLEINMTLYVDTLGTGKQVHEVSMNCIYVKR
ncbi:hypothetical protein GGR28_003775 [Lewinella aquimaris]|uniref:Uncharacterized protein n=1 Tax=Neolewinella aquimaris TaxID=1835722 RepID=A0A840EGW6_9BACT|nr:hypothetical protein [Neolewinella aquimaris]MBB4081128.1 hypothetical protein [Neolewinella aquimaris]